MSRGKDALKVGAAVAACGLCCPPVLLVPLGLVAGLGAGATTATAALGAPLWAVLIPLAGTTIMVGLVWSRRRSRARRAPVVTAQDRAMLPLIQVTGQEAHPDVRPEDVARR